MTRRTAAGAVLVLLTLFSTACSNPRERAREMLGRMNITHSEDSFVERAKDGDLIVVARFLDAGMAPDATNAEGKTALMAAAEGGRLQVAQLLVAKGADVNARDRKFSGTPLIWGALGGSSGVVKLLLEHGADPAAREGKSGMTALQTAAGRGELQSVQLLLDRGADVNEKDKAGRTAVIAAAARGRAGVLKLLADKGADLSSVDAGGRTPLMWAARSGNAETVEVLLQHRADVNATDRKGNTAVTLARAGKHTAIESLLVKAGAAPRTAAAKLTAAGGQSASLR